MLVNPDTKVTIENMDAILRFLPIFEADGFTFGEWEAGATSDGEIVMPEKDGVLQMPEVEYSDEVWEFVSAAEKNNWIIRFDWRSWTWEAAPYLDSQEVLKTADVEVLRKLLTAHIRNERFCTGHLLSVLKSGHIAAILKRLREIREELR